MKSRSNPTSYSPVPFHAVRLISAFSCVVVAGILAYFCRQLLADNFKIPWTFIIVLIAALATIAALIFTSLISCCCNSLSPIFNIFVNICLLIAWIIGTTILTWNLYGALGHSCSITNWGNDRGVMVCNVYKILYTFVIFAGLSQVAQIVLDVRARRNQIGRGKYDKMRDSQDIKMTDTLPPVPASVVHDTPVAMEPTLQQQVRDDQSQYQQDYRDESPGWRPGQRPSFNQTQSYTSSHSTHSNSNYSHRNNDQHHGYNDTHSMQLQDFSYQRPQQSTHYEPRSYSPNPNGYGYQQNTYYQGRY